MNGNEKVAMPQEYEYLNGSLRRAQEHLFLIKVEIERLQNNSINDDRLNKLLHEQRAVINGIKQDFEMQTWEDGPLKFKEVENVIDHQFSEVTYRRAKNALLETGKNYSTSRYWIDKLERNLEYYKRQELELREVKQALAQEGFGQYKERNHFIYGDGFIMG